MVVDLASWSVFAKEKVKVNMSMGCSSMVSKAAFGPGDPGTNPDWFAVLNSNKKLRF